MRSALPLALAVATACGGSPPTPADLLPAAPPDLDLLFVIDDSSGTSTMQAHLAGAFTTFMSTLADDDGALPNLHIGVISSSVGIEPYAAGTCVGNGDDGILLADPAWNCAGPAIRYIVDVANPDGTRTTNYPDTSTLGNVFACIARLGDNGCAFPQPLEAMRRALDGHRRENDGFLRPGAHLAIVIVADQDDCSAADPALFDPWDPALGPFSSFRCAEYGYLCDGAPLPRAPVELTADCEPAPTGYLHHPADYVDFVRQLDGPASVHVFSLVAPSSPLRVIPSGDGFQIDRLCVFHGWGGAAAPGIRLRWFADQFGDPQRSLCNPWAVDDFRAIGPWLRRSFDPCLAADVDLPLDCQVTHNGVAIPACPMLDATTPTPGAGPCWWTTPHCASGAPTFHLDSDPPIPFDELEVSCAHAS